MSVNWVVAADGVSLEISSRDHLIQLMNGGSVFTDTGSPPSSYLTASYVQTVDIDLQLDETNVVPIGTFRGVYDGQGFAISNWSSTVTSDDSNGLFEMVNGGTIQNLVLSGVFKSGESKYTGFLAARVISSSIYNITASFSPGTEIINAASVSGVLFGLVDKSDLQNITLCGTVDKFECAGTTGGIAGGVYTSGKLSFIRNMAVFTERISPGSYAGGIVGYTNGDVVYDHILNAMTGDMGSSVYCAGFNGNMGGGTASNICISMQGELTGIYTSALVSNSTGDTASLTDSLVYMKGSLASGIVGNTKGMSFSNCFVAANGHITYPAYRTGYDATQTSEIVFTTSQGMTYTTLTGAVEGTKDDLDLTAFATSNVDYEQLPFFEFKGVDDIGNVIDWPFIIGTGEHFAYITGDGPDHVFGYTNNLNVLDPNYLSAPLFSSVIPGPISVKVGIFAVEGATSYKITLQESGGSEIDYAITEDEELTVKSLTPDTEYTMKLYFGTGTADTLKGEQTFSTLENSAANYDKDSFLAENGTSFDFSDLDSTSRNNLSSVMNDLFTTGDKLQVKVNNEVSDVTFVKRGESVSISNNSVFLIPFDSESGSSQSIDIQLDNSTVSVGYNESTDTISVQSVEYSIGDSFVLDGKKVTMVDY